MLNRDALTVSNMECVEMIVNIISADSALQNKDMT